MEDIDVLPTSDPNVATQEQKMAKVEALGQLIQMGTVNQQEFTKRFLEAAEIPNIEALMQMPEPQPDPQVEFEKQKFDDESQRGWEELEIKRTTAEAAAIKNYADAEGVEEGQQLQQYAAFMKGEQDNDLSGMKLNQMQEAHQQKMQQMQQQSQQKMQQQEQAFKQKLAQQSATGGSNEPTAGGNQ